MPSCSALRCFAVLLCLPALAQAFTLASADWQIDFSPETLGAEARLPDGSTLILSHPGPVRQPLGLQQDGAEWRWHYADGLDAAARLENNVLKVSFRRATPGSVNWPIVPENGKGLILPLGEGIYIPAGDNGWRKALLRDYHTVDTTQDLSLPLLGIDHGKHVVTVLFANPFNNQVEFSGNTHALAIRARHEFTRLDTTRPYKVQIALGGEDWLAPAKQYRAWLQQREEFVPLAQKLAASPDGNRLIGASHVYLWGDRLLTADSVKSWPDLQKLVPADWLKGSEEHAAAQAPDLARNRYLQQVLLASIERALLKAYPASDAASMAQRKTLAAKTLGKALKPEQDWGDGAATGMIRALQTAGLKKLWLGLPQWTAGFASPAGVAAARKAGYLIGPYDSYDTALPVPNSNPSWLSAQLGEDAFLRCGVQLENGQRKKGFQGEGVYTNPACIRGLMEQRVKKLQQTSPYNSWFIDVAGSGMLFDDYDPAKPTSQAQDAQNRNEAQAWLMAQGLVVGTEDGNAVVNRNAAFAHGLQTRGFGWGDADMRKNKTSPYYLGNWYPDYQPATFFKPAQVKAEYRDLYFDPVNRLPLFQAAFHDSIVTTHHWTLDSLKFPDVRATSELLAQLYNVPPLINLSQDTLESRLPVLQRLDAFFRPLHERLYNQALTGFSWLRPDGSLQETRFADGTRIIANFSNATIGSAKRVMPPHSAIAILPDGNTLEFIAEKAAR